MAKLLLCFEGTIVKEFKLDRDRFTIGRRPNNDIQIDHLAVSGEHAVLSTVGDDVFVEDLGSTNGTRVNGMLVTRQLLQHDDEITVGKQFIVKFCRENAAGTASNPDFEPTVMLPVPPVTSQSTASQSSDRMAIVGSEMLKPSVIKVLTGVNAGRELLLTQNLTTLGSSGVQVVAISRQPQGYFITHVEGEQPPKVNGALIGRSAHKLDEEDLIELLGVQMAFFTH